MRLDIVVLPGDGIGPEVTGVTCSVLRALCEAHGHEVSLREELIGGIAIDQSGVALPERTLRACQEAGAILLGAVGGPKWDDPHAAVRPEQGLLGLRKALGLFANIRPVQVQTALAQISPVRVDSSRTVNMTFVRELTGGIYFGEKKLTRSEDQEVASDTCTYSTREIERVARLSMEMAAGRRGHLTSVDKANVLETSRLWRRTVTRIAAEEFPSLTVEHMLVDACAMHLIQNPQRFDVVLTENMFGDILTDEASVLCGSLGLLPSASLGASLNEFGMPRGLYEPIHGSAPDIVGKGIANPVGSILSAAMMLRYSFGLVREADELEWSVTAVLDGGVRTADISYGGNATSTSEFGDAVSRRWLLPARS